eukprot:2136191-Alexandrium_andersonii.AAC.1
MGKGLRRPPPPGPSDWRLRRDFCASVPPSEGVGTGSEGHVTADSRQGPSADLCPGRAGPRPGCGCTAGAP